jgi:hypothetical protein
MTVRRTPQSAMTNPPRHAKTNPVPMTAGRTPQSAMTNPPRHAKTNPVPMTAARTSEVTPGQVLARVTTSILATNQYETTPGWRTVGTSRALAADT